MICKQLLLAAFSVKKKEKLNNTIMKQGIHPDYREVVFHDMSADVKFISRSTIKTGDTINMEDGKTYPLVKLEVSSASHPFYTGKKMFLDAEGRVEKFNKRYKK
jgi:large subunit ribosomal protein L31